MKFMEGLETRGREKRKGKDKKRWMCESNLTDGEQEQTLWIPSSRAALPQHWLWPQKEFPLVEPQLKRVFWPTELRPTLPADTDPDVNTRTHTHTHTPAIIAWSWGQEDNMASSTLPRNPPSGLTDRSGSFFKVRGDSWLGWCFAQKWSSFPVYQRLVSGKDSLILFEGWENRRKNKAYWLDGVNKPPTEANRLTDK